MTKLQQKHMWVIDKMENFYLKNFVEDAQDGTVFDLMWLDMFEEMRENVLPSTEAELG